MLDDLIKKVKSQKIYLT